MCLGFLNSIIFFHLAEETLKYSLYKMIQATQAYISSLNLLSIFCKSVGLSSIGLSSRQTIDTHPSHVYPYRDINSQKLKDKSKKIQEHRSPMNNHGSQYFTQTWVSEESIEIFVCTCQTFHYFLFLLIYKIHQPTPSPKTTTN